MFSGSLRPHGSVTPHSTPLHRARFEGMNESLVTKHSTQQHERARSQARGDHIAQVGGNRLQRLQGGSGCCRCDGAVSCQLSLPVSRRDRVTDDRPWSFKCWQTRRIPLNSSLGFSRCLASKWVSGRSLKSGSWPLAVGQGRRQSLDAIKQAHPPFAADARAYEAYHAYVFVRPLRVVLLGPLLWRQCLWELPRGSSSTVGSYVCS